jgi:UDP-3-O-[3-hydroxymyristoyl] glucosamine N-acyltransferase
VNLYASDIARFLNLELIGKDLPILGVASLNNIKSNSVVFAKKYSVDTISDIMDRRDLFLICSEVFQDKLKCAYVISANPKLDFAKSVSRFFSPTPPVGISRLAWVSKSAIIAEDVFIGHFCTIGDNVVIGSRTRIMDGVVVSENCRIGSDVLIKSHSVIGQEGFGFEFEEDRTPIRVPHLGSVVIGNHVEIGALTVIARGTIDNTIIHDHVKIDDHVFIAHNVQIGKNSFVIAGAEISGSVSIGENVWIAPQATLINQITVGNNSLVGIGAVVIKSVAENVVVAGNPARVISDRK